MEEKELEELFPEPVYWGVPRDLAELANSYAQASVFADYQLTKSWQTLRRHKAELNLFARYLKEAHGTVTLTGETLYSSAEAWRNMSYGLLEGFKRWLIWQGYTIGTTNVRVDTVKQYAHLAYQAGVLTQEEWTHIAGIHRINAAQARHVNKKREINRVGRKKERWVILSEADRQRLKHHSNPKMALLMCILLDLGLRCGEIAELQYHHFNIFEQTVLVERPKVNKTQTHKFSPDMRSAALAYLSTPGQGYVFGHNTRTIYAWVRKLGKEIGIGVVPGSPPLSPHDCRHDFVTQQIKRGASIKDIQQAGGWASPAMVLKYASDNEIANEGMIF